MRINDETNDLLTALALKANCVLNSVIRDLPEYEAEYRELSFASETYNEFATKSRQLALKASRNALVAIAAAHRMHNEVDGIFWTSLAQQLLDRERCMYQRFGAFSSKELGNRVNVNFISSLDDPGEAYDFLEPRGEAEWFLTKDLAPIFRAIGKSVSIIEQTHANGNARIALLVSEYLSNSLPVVFGEVRNKDITDVFATLAQATSLATYEAWLCAFFSELTHGHEITIYGVGNFDVIDGKVRFSASELFLGMLAANQLQKDNA